MKVEQRLIQGEIRFGTDQPVVFSHAISSGEAFNLKLHLHNEPEVYIFVRGDVDFMIDDHYLSLSPGTVVIARENQLHRPIIRSAAVYERFYLSLPRSAFAKEGKSPLDFLEKENEILSLNAETYCKLLEYLRLISGLVGVEGFQEHYLAYAWVLQVMKLLNDAAEQRKLPLPQANMPALIKNVMNYVETHAGETSSVRELAEAFGVHPGYLSGLFAEVTRIHLKHYLTIKRIAIAKEKLLEEQTVTDVAYECGFSSCSHFIAVFRKNTGQTPEQYRRENGGKGRRKKGIHALF